MANKREKARGMINRRTEAKDEELKRERKR